MATAARRRASTRSWAARAMTGSCARPRYVRRRRNVPARWPGDDVRRFVGQGQPRDQGEPNRARRSSSPRSTAVRLWRRVLSGNPETGSTSYDVCLFDDADNLVASLLVDRAGDTCAGKPCWKAKKDTGWQYQDKGASSDGVTKMKLSAAPPGRPRFRCRPRTTRRRDSFRCRRGSPPRCKHRRARPFRSWPATRSASRSRWTRSRSRRRTPSRG